MVKNATEEHVVYYDSTCEVKSNQMMRIVVQVDKVTVRLLHDKYQMEIFRLESEQLKLGYETWYDHSQLFCSLKSVALSDTTNYPYTISPKAFFEAAKVGKSLDVAFKL